MIERRRKRICCFPIAILFVLLVGEHALADEVLKPGVLKAGIVGCDTSHCVAFTKVINNPKATGALAKVEVAAAFPGGSPDIASSRDRVEGFTNDLRKRGIEIVDSIDELVGKCDVFLLESIDGRVHLEQFRKIAVGKPVFMDKPAAANLADVIAIGKLARETNTPCFTSSALRYSKEVVGLKTNKKVGELLGCNVASPYKIEPTHSDFYWYGVHGVESLFTLMGTGCEAVECIETDSAAVATGVWNGGRLGTYRGLKEGKSTYTFELFGTKGTAHASGFSGYTPAVEVMGDFFVTRQAPIDWDETVEIFAFMEAARESKNRNGERVTLQSVIERARESRE